MSISISNSFSPTSFAAANSYSNSAAAQKIQQTTNDSADTVKLSESQQSFNSISRASKSPISLPVSA